MGYYKNYIPEHQHDNLKASEIRDINEAVSRYGSISAINLFTMFILASCAIALLLWSNKFTIFITSISGLINLIMFSLSYEHFKMYRKVVKKTQERLDSLQNKNGEEM